MQCIYCFNFVHTCNYLALSPAGDFKLGKLLYYLRVLVIAGNLQQIFFSHFHTLIARYYPVIAYLELHARTNVQEEHDLPRTEIFLLCLCYL